MNVLVVIALIFALVFTFYLVNRGLEWFEARAADRSLRKTARRTALSRP